MKKKTLLSLLLGCFCLGSCVNHNSSTSKTTSSGTTTFSSSSSSSSASTSASSSSSSISSSSSSQSGAYEWSNEELALFNQYLDGYIIPTLPIKPYRVRYFLNSIEIQSDLKDGIAVEYTHSLEGDGFTSKFDVPSNSYYATKDINEDKYVYIEYCELDDEEDHMFLLYVGLRNINKDREHVWTNDEIKLFNDNLDGYVLPFPDTTYVSMQKQHNEVNNKDMLHIYGTLSDTIVSSYLAQLVSKGFKLDKHPTYGIDRGFLQLSNNKYIEVWVANAENQFFEVLAYLYQGTKEVIDDKHVQFGSYPQSRVSYGTDEFFGVQDLLADLPTEENHDGWNVFDDYFADGLAGEHAFYQDVEYNGEKYRATYALSPRSLYYTQPLNDDDPYRPPYQTDVNGYTSKSLFIFKFEPIFWEIMNTENGVQTLAPTSILDVNYFATFEEPFKGEDERMVYQSNYEHSFIRQWINSTFYNFAFSSTEQDKIQVTHVDNSINQNEATEDDYNTQYVVREDIDWHDYLSNDTDDKVFLLSRHELVTWDFGYGNTSNWGSDIDCDKACKPATDYALSRGAHPHYDFKETVFENSTTFYLRTPLICSYQGNLIHLSDQFSGLSYSYVSPTQCLSVYPCINVKF